MSLKLTGYFGKLFITRKMKKDKEIAFETIGYFFAKVSISKRIQKSFSKQKLTTKDAVDAIFMPALRIA